MEEEAPQPPEPDLPDSTSIRMTALADYPVSRLDILVYGGGDIQSLERHEVLEDLQGTEEISTTAGPKTVLVIANCPYSLNLKALDRLESAMQMTFEFKDEDHLHPIMTGRAEIEAGDSAEIVLKPFLCRVILKEASNAMDGFELVEGPRIWLSELNPSVTLLQEKDFRPTDFIPDGEPSNLPCDIGFYTQRPDVTLYCYPNDTPEDELGVPHTSLIFEGKIDGQVCRASFPLPPIGPGSLTNVSVTVHSAEDIRFETLK